MLKKTGSGATLVRLQKNYLTLPCQFSDLYKWDNNIPT